MTAVEKKAPIGLNTPYKLAAAARRAKIASTKLPLEREVLPIAGKIRVVLSGKPIPRDHQEALFGFSAIDIPEFRQARKKLA
jgi:hypothetical protein